LITGWDGEESFDLTKKIGNWGGFGKRILLGEGEKNLRKS
jgi:hypothetical protein